MLCSRAVTQPPELLVFRTVRALDPCRALDEIVDVVVERGRITRVGRDAGADLVTSERAQVVNGQGLWLMPAFTDLHVHFREPGYEYKEDIASGLASAAAGGYAHVCAMPNTTPVNDTRAVTELMVNRAASLVAPRLHPIGAITQGLKGQQLTEMAELREAGAVAVSDDGVCLQSSSMMRRALEYAKNFGLPVMQHAEDMELVAGGDMHEGAISARMGLRGRPSVAEDIIVARDILLAEYVDTAYHVTHISTRGAARLVHQAKERGQKVTCEVTPHHLLLTDAACLGYETFCKVNPPLREAADVDALVNALADGTIDAIATDHAPHAPLEKDCEFSEAAPGMIGLELCFPLLLDLVRAGRVPLLRLIEAMSQRPSQIISLEPPRVAVGALAELVLFDPEARWTAASTGLRSKSRNTPFMNRELTGRVLMTIAAGRPVFRGLEGAK